MTRRTRPNGDRARGVGERPERRQRLFAGPVELDHREELPELRSGALQPSELAAELLGQRERAGVPAFGHSTAAEDPGADASSSAPPRNSSPKRSA